MESSKKKHSKKKADQVDFKKLFKVDLTAMRIEIGFFMSDRWAIDTLYLFTPVQVLFRKDSKHPHQCRSSCWYHFGVSSSEFLVRETPYPTSLTPSLSPPLPLPLPPSLLLSFRIMIRSSKTDLINGGS